MLSEDGSIEIGFGLAIAFFGFIAPLFMGGSIWQNMTSMGSLTVFFAGVALIIYGRYLRRKSRRESDERIRRNVAEHLERASQSSQLDNTWRDGGAS